MNPPNPELEERAKEARTATVSPLGERATPPRNPHPILPVLLTLLVLGLAGGAFVAGNLLGKVTSAPPPSVVSARPTPSIITAVRDLARLETGEVQVEKVIDLTDTQSRLFGLVKGTDALLLVAGGKAIVGVDLSKLGDGDVSLDPVSKTARLSLPGPELFSVSLDEDRTYVYERNTSLLAKKNERLEAQARREATAAIEKAARSPDVLSRAKGQAERELRALLTPLGAERVEITWRE
jgi:Protein of unknown function (DUF4230)